MVIEVDGVFDDVVTDGDSLEVTIPWREGPIGDEPEDACSFLDDFVDNSGDKRPWWISEVVDVAMPDEVEGVCTK